ncbi:hypothetical protein [Rhodococcus sp. Q1]|uniref:hypothetical protein n=1 Tax=unclassified Rhodococcus (in: high G+C Gram-positive bacteria) TaxID=192944 RepID=UPI0013EC3E97|nr:hypothetical protein [Rhodococcus sp. Q1]
MPAVLMGQVRSARRVGRAAATVCVLMMVSASTNLEALSRGWGYLLDEQAALG